MVIKGFESTQGLLSLPEYVAPGFTEDPSGRKIFSEDIGNGERFYYEISSTVQMREVARGASVTTILDVLAGDFVDWAVKQAIAAIWREKPRSLKACQELGVHAYRDAVEYHSEVGTRLHNLTHLPKQELYDTSSELTFLLENKEIAEMVQTAVSSWIEFTNDAGEIIWVDREQRMLCLGPWGWFGGKYDCYWEMDDGRRVIVDLKTSRYLYPKYYYQVAAYGHAFRNGRGGGLIPWHERRVDGLWLLRLNKYWQSYQLKEADPREDLECFYAAHRLYLRHQKHMDAAF